MSKGRKQSQGDIDATEIFSDADFDADEFVGQMEALTSWESNGRAGWRRLEALRDERALRRQLEEFADWNDLDD